MDPEANLHDQIVTANEIMADADNDAFLACKAQELAELVLALYEWRTKGGFDPYIAMMEKGWTVGTVRLTD